MSHMTALSGAAARPRPSPSSDGCGRRSSQSAFYLLCTQLGLGPYITAAIDDAELERALDLDPLFEAPLAVCGCGRAPAQRSPLDPEFRSL
jgi:hypothetical protein